MLNPAEQICDDQATCCCEPCKHERLEQLADRTRKALHDWPDGLDAPSVVVGPSTVRVSVDLTYEDGAETTQVLADLAEIGQCTARAAIAQKDAIIWNLLRENRALKAQSEDAKQQIREMLDEMGRIGA